MYETIELNSNEIYNEIVLNRPEKLNALSERMVNDLHEALSYLANSPPKMVLIRGNGDSFCSGHDINEGVDLTDQAKVMNYLNKMQEITKLIVAFKAPVISMIHGYTLGAGFEIALNSDLIYAAKDTKIGFPELKVGLSITQGSSYFLVKKVGLLKAKELLFFGENILAEDAKNIGLINDIYEKHELLAKVREKILTLGERPLASMSIVKNLLHEGYSGTLEASLENEINALVKIYSE